MTERSKEELILAQRRAMTEVDCRTKDAVLALALGADDVRLKDLARTVGWAWERTALASFDLRRADEQGRLIQAGWLVLPPAPDARKCLALTGPGVQCQEPATHAGHELESPRCFQHAPERFSPIVNVCLTWKAREHLDDVLHAGAERVTARVRAALEAGPLPANIAAAVSVLKPGELLVLEASPKTSGQSLERLMQRLEGVLPSMGARGIVLEGPVRRESVEHLRAVLREVGYDVVPSLHLGPSLGPPPPRRKPVPETREQFLEALGLENGVAYPGLRENVAQWLGLPLTEEQARVAEEAPRRLVTQRCRRCPDPFEEVVCQCSPTHSRAVPKADAFASNNGWRCATCTASEALNALQSIAGMLDLPAGGDVTKVVPEAVRNVLTAIQAVGPLVRDGFAAVAPFLSGEQRAVSNRLTQEALDAIGKDFGCKPTSLEELQQRPILAVSGGVLTEEAAVELGALVRARARGKYHKVLVLESEPEQAQGTLVLRLPSGREVALEHGPRVLAEAIIRDAVESGAAREEVAAKLAAVFEETTGFTAEENQGLAGLWAQQRLGRQRAHGPGRAAREAAQAHRREAVDEGALLREVQQASGLPRGDLRGVSNLTMEQVDAIAKKLGVTTQALLDKLHEMVDRALLAQGAAQLVTFAGLLAAGRPARVVVLEPVRAKHDVLFEYLEQMGGVIRKPTMRVHCGPVTVQIVADPQRAAGLTCDVAVGFSQVDGSRLVRSATSLIVLPEAAQRFWGMA